MKIENYREQHLSESSKVIAFFDIYLEKAHMIFRNWKVIRTSKGWMAVSPSYKKGEDDDGRPQFGPLIEILDKRKEDFNSSLFSALKPYVKI